MTASVPGQEINPSSTDFAADDRIRRRAKGSLKQMLLWVPESFDLIEAAPADDPDRCTF
jgi:hypothetical protein